MLLQELISFSIARSYGNDKTSIVQMLNDLQSHYGYLPKEELVQFSKLVDLSLSKIWGIITFYSHYKLTKPAKHPVQVCSGTACHVRNSSLLKEVFEEKIRILPEDAVSVEKVACLGCCALAPVFEASGVIHGNMTKEKVEALVNDIKLEEGVNG